MDVSSIALGDGFRNRMRLVTDNRGVRMLPKFAGLASGSFVPDTHPMVAFRAGTVCDRVVASSSGGGLFGRPVISYPGRFLFLGQKLSALGPLTRAENNQSRQTLPSIP